jgi:hypothetical protein
MFKITSSRFLVLALFAALAVSSSLTKTAGPLTTGPAGKETIHIQFTLPRVHNQ